MKPTAVFYLTWYSLSLLGNSIAAIALPLILLQATGSIMSAGVLAASTAFPAFLAGPPVVDAVAGLDRGWFILFGILGAAVTCRA